MYEEKDGKTGARGLRSRRGRAVHRPSRFGPRLVADRQTESTMALRRAGDRAMIEMEAALRKTSRITPRRRRHSMGCGSHHCFRSSVPDLLDLARRRGAGGASRSNRDGHNRAPQLYRSDDSAGGRRNAAGRNTAGSGGSSLAGAATTASQHRRSYCRQPSGPTCRAESRHRATLHPGRMGTPGALAPGSR